MPCDTPLCPDRATRGNITLFFALASFALALLAALLSLALSKRERASGPVGSIMENESVSAFLLLSREE